MKQRKTLLKQKGGYLQRVFGIGDTGLRKNISRDQFQEASEDRAGVHC